MRPTGRPQSALRHPLNHILGTEAAVRVLRVVMLSDIPVGVSELARLTSLQASGVARVCTKLEDLGVIEAVGRGARNRQFRRAARFGLSGSLMMVFTDERGRAEQVMQDLKAAVQTGSAPMRAGWIEGSVARGADGPGEPVVVGVLAEPADVERVREEVWRKLLDLQLQRDLTIDLRVVTIADLKTASRERRAELEQVLPLLGPPPLDLLESRAAKGGRTKSPRHQRHGDLDARSLELGRMVADRIRRDPSLVDEAKRYIERRLPLASSGERLELEEWRGILRTMSLSRLRRFLLQDDARATRLRQSSPFLSAITPEERRQVFARPAGTT